jgi:5-methylcytosine-specific restriction endonuclease McrA
MSWFNVLKYWGRRDNDFLQFCRDNKGRFIRFFDSDYRELTEEEIKNLEVETATPAYSILQEQENNTVYQPKIKAKKIAQVETLTRGRGRPRKLSWTKLRKEIISLAEGKCSRCNASDADQVHHINGDRNDNRKENLRLLCYYCHKMEHKVNGKRRYKKIDR